MQLEVRSYEKDFSGSTLDSLSVGLRWMWRPISGAYFRWEDTCRYYHLPSI
ncbi:hypothetical protein KKC1_34950 [Calderihabitans maritimus]|uniref:Uncharacterized protein n=1 Tax=Calderihabitans maritimus TaxID=1246530 RepID=A0A1Z5HYN3_9FIRM|nr:hypothetical protein KKC1_34950 [Calderihabitans maritimus]